MGASVCVCVWYSLTLSSRFHVTTHDDILLTLDTFQLNTSGYEQCKHVHLIFLSPYMCMVCTKHWNTSQRPGQTKHRRAENARKRKRESKKKVIQKHWRSNKRALTVTTKTTTMTKLPSLNCVRLNWTFWSECFFFNIRDVVYTCSVRQELKQNALHSARERGWVSERVTKTGKKGERTFLAKTIDWRFKIPTTITTENFSYFWGLVGS